MQSVHSRMQLTWRSRVRSDEGPHPPEHFGQRVGPAQVDLAKRHASQLPSICSAGNMMMIIIIIITWRSSSPTPVKWP